MHVQFFYTHARTHRWYPSRHNCSLSMLHCVMESETTCAALVLALNAWRVILKTRLICETAVKITEELSCCRSEAWRCWLLAQLICCSMWVASYRYVIVRGFNDSFASSEMSTRKFFELLELNNDHMCCMFTKHGSLIKTSLIFIQTVCMVSFAYTHKSSF